MALDEKLFLALVRDGLNGDKASFEMRARRLAHKLSKSDKNLAVAVNEVLSNNSVLRGTLDFQTIATPVDSDSRQKLLIETYPVSLEAEPILSELNRAKIERVFRERELTDKLLAEGLTPTRSLLLEGPPGVGKTLTAKWIAYRLNLPLLTLDLATVMSSFLGKTGNNIRAVLKHATSFPCVLLLDEFDSIGKKRDDDSDVGELKRLVTVLLQAIDEWPVTSILIAATNHGELLDSAVWRRFDKHLTFDKPSSELIECFLNNWGLPLNQAQWLAASAEHSSIATLEKKINQAKKNSILEGIDLLDAIVEEFQIDSEPPKISEKEARNAMILKLHGEGFSQRKISETLNISRPTVAKVINNQA